jgi:hypothetical protein
MAGLATMFENDAGFESPDTALDRFAVCEAIRFLKDAFTGLVGVGSFCEAPRDTKLDITLSSPT